MLVLGLKLILYKCLTQNWPSFHDHFRTENKTIGSLCFRLKGTSRDDLIEPPAEARTCFGKVPRRIFYCLQGWGFHNLLQQIVLQFYSHHCHLFFFNIYSEFPSLCLVFFASYPISVGLQGKHGFAPLEPPISYLKTAVRIQ